MHRIRAAAVVFLLATPARADELSSDEPEITEVSHEVTARLIRPDLAELTVTRTLSNPSKTTGIADLRIDTAEGSVVTGMRSRSNQVWHRATLRGAGEAERLFWRDDTTGSLGDLALLAWEHPRGVKLQVQVPSRGFTLVEYTLLAPTRREAGRSHIAYGAKSDDKKVAPPVLRAGRTALWIDGAAIPAGGHRVLVDGSVDVAIASDPGRLAVHHGRALFAAGRSSAARVHIDAPTRLSPAPAGIHVVFVIDASRSMTDDDVKAQLDIAAAYLAAAPGARFELVRFDHQARRLIGRFARAAELETVRQALADKGAFELANGSHLDRGIDAAMAALRGRSNPRVVMLSDGSMRSRFSNTAAIASLRRVRGTIAHYVEPELGLGEPDRTINDHDRAPIAAATGGTALAIDASQNLERTGLQLVRPIRIDDLEISGPLPGQHPDTPGQLYEGDGIRLASVLEEVTPETVVVSGRIWAKPIRRRVRADRRESDRAAALVFGDSEIHALPDGEVRALAMRGGVVSPATSLLVARSGARENPGGGGVGFGTVCGGCRLGTIGHGSGTGSGSQPDPITLAAPLRQCADKLGVDIIGEALVEVDGVEILDVEVKVGDPSARACLTEAIWAHRLTASQARGIASLVIPLTSAALP